MRMFDRLLAASLPLVPRPVVRYFSRAYIAGETAEDAVREVENLNREGARATVDVLGEDTLDAAQAERIVEEYLGFARLIRERSLDCNLSVKLTALGLLIDRALCERNLRVILEEAGKTGLFVRIDMEDSSVTSATLDLYRKVRRDHRGVGPVLQAYLRRSLGDARELLRFHQEIGEPLNVRLCKGIYDEPPTIAFKDPEVIRRSYQNLLQLFLREGAYVGVATHDEVLLYEGLRLIDELSLDASRYEFQMLHGVLPAMRRLLVSEGYPMRVYVPYGSNWYGYSVRRLRENPRIAGYVFRQVVFGSRGEAKAAGRNGAGG